MAHQSPPTPPLPHHSAIEHAHLAAYWGCFVVASTSLAFEGSELQVVEILLLLDYRHIFL
jgi:hypothetical protein